MKYIMQRYYDNGRVEIRSVSKKDMEVEGLKKGYHHTDRCDIWVDEFTSERAFDSFWMSCVSEGAKVVFS